MINHDLGKRARTPCLCSADVVNSGLQVFPGLPATVNTFRQPRNLALDWRFSPTNNIANEFVTCLNRFGYAFSSHVNYSTNGFLDSFVAAQQGVSTPLMQQIVNADSRHTTGQNAVQFLQKYYAAKPHPQ